LANPQILVEHHFSASISLVPFVFQSLLVQIAFRWHRSSARMRRRYPAQGFRGYRAICTKPHRKGDFQARSRAW